mgnify:CR=1 FL=1
MIPQHHLPADIERTSMQIIAKELDERHIRIPRENLAVVKRVIHTTADFEYAETLHFTENAVPNLILILSVACGVGAKPAYRSPAAYPATGCSGVHCR